jgi:hypothetical protein
MSEMSPEITFMLPPSVVTKVDVARLISEMEQLDSDLVTRDAHQKSGVPITNQLTISEPLRDFLTMNKLEIGSTAERATLMKQMREFKLKAPVVHITFAAPADLESLRKLAAWFREEVHPQSIIAVGLQPSLIGGAYVRTPNHVHDFSLRARLAGHRDIITSEVEALRGSN